MQLRIQLLAVLVAAMAAPAIARAGPTRYDLQRTPMLWSYASSGPYARAKARAQAAGEKSGGHDAAPAAGCDSGR